MRRSSSAALFRGRGGTGASYKHWALPLRQFEHGSPLSHLTLRRAQSEQACLCLGGGRGSSGAFEEVGDILPKRRRSLNKEQYGILSRQWFLGLLSDVKADGMAANERINEMPGN